MANELGEKYRSDRSYVLHTSLEYAERRRVGDLSYRLNINIEDERNAHHQCGKLIFVSLSLSLEVC